MKQGQDLACAAADVLVRLLCRVFARLPGWAGMRHGLKRPRLVLTPDREAQAARPACRPARSAPFYRRIRVDDRDRAMLAPARGYPGLAPGAAPLPALAGRVQGVRQI